MRLAELELAFWQAVRARGAPPPGLDALFSAPSARGATERLGIYHHAYWQRQVLAMSSVFPRLRVHLGAVAFERLVLRYIERWPSHEPCIERLGAQLAAFLADGPRLERDIARLEWASACALLAPDRAALRAIPSELASQLPNCRLELHPSLHVEEVVSRAAGVFGGGGDDADVSSAAARGGAMVPERRCRIAFYRQHFSVRHVVLDVEEALALESAGRGDNFAMICEAFSNLAHETAVSRTVSVLSGWLARGWVTQIAPGGTLDEP